MLLLSRSIVRTSYTTAPEKARERKRKKRKEEEENQGTESVSVLCVSERRK